MSALVSQERGELYVTKPVFLSDLKLLLRLSASVFLLLYLSFLSTEKYPDIRICMISHLSFLFKTVILNKEWLPRFFACRVGTKQLTERRDAENGSNHDSSEAARSGQAADIFHLGFLFSKPFLRSDSAPLEFPKAINPNLKSAMDYPAPDLCGQVKSFSPPGPSPCNSHFALSGSRPCSTSGLWQPGCVREGPV